MIRPAGEQLTLTFNLDPDLGDHGGSRCGYCRRFLIASTVDPGAFECPRCAPILRAGPSLPILFTGSTRENATLDWFHRFQREAWSERVAL